jgi:hypothetical protein
MPTNIVSTTAIYGKTTAGRIPADGANVLINPTGSGKILRVSTLLVSNTTGTANADLIAVIRRGGTTTASSAYFDGYSGYLTMNSNAGLTFTGDFTIEAWIYLDSLPNYFAVLDTRASTGNTSYCLYAVNSSFYRLAWVDTTGTQYSTVPIFLQQWTHIVVCRVSNIISFYTNGMKDTVSFVNSDTMTANNSNPRIGRMLDGQYGNGYLEELRASNIGRYSSDFSVPTAPFTDNETNTKLLMHADGLNGSTVFTDSVSAPHVLTAVGGAAIKTTQSAFIGNETRIAHRITVPAQGTLAVLSKENPIYLEEGDRIFCTASADNRLEYICSYEEIA